MITPCSSGLERSLRELHYLVEQDGWWELQAVRAREVYVIDHNYFSRPGPRIVMGLEILAQIVHPELFHDMIPAATALKLELPPDVRARRQRLPGTFSRIRWWSAHERSSSLAPPVAGKTTVAAIMGALRRGAIRSNHSRSVLITSTPLTTVSSAVCRAGTSIAGSSPPRRFRSCFSAPWSARMWP